MSGVGSWARDRDRDPPCRTRGPPPPPLHPHPTPPTPAGGPNPRASLPGPLTARRRSKRSFGRNISSFRRSKPGFGRSISCFGWSKPCFVRSVSCFGWSISGFLRSKPGFVRSVRGFVRSISRVRRAGSGPAGFSGVGGRAGVLGPRRWGLLAPGARRPKDAHRCGGAEDRRAFARSMGLFLGARCARLRANARAAQPPRRGMRPGARRLAGADAPSRGCWGARATFSARRRWRCRGR